MRWLVLAIALLLPAIAAAQTIPTVLVADSLRIESAGSRLVAEGAVEVFHGARRLRAQRITYDRVRGELLIEGPITLVEGDRTLVLADAAALSSDLRNGILSSARLVLDDQLQLAAAEVRRVNGRYTELSKTVASSCQVCANDPVPLWSIRARRVVHDTEGRQLYFDHATFRVMDLPVFYLPRLRLPDPTLERATGFLIPDIRTTSQLDLGLKLPYFIVMGPSRDLTLTPYFSSKTRTLELRYRQAFRFGSMTFTGAVSDDDILPDKIRAYLFGTGTFRLPRDFRAAFAVELTSDPAYLLDYGYSEKDRLQSSAGIDRVRRNERIEARIVNFRTLRESEIPFEDRLPYLLGEAMWERRFPGIAGGAARLRLSFEGHQRASTEGSLGRDVLRTGVLGEWRRDWFLPNGMIAGLETRVAADLYAVSHDSDYPGQIGRVAPGVAATLRWPLIRAGARGTTDLLEPLAQIAWSDVRGGAVPNEDSVLVEFDESSLLSLHRFPGEDRVETGLRGAAGLAWTRTGPGDWNLGVTVGRVFRADPPSDFTQASGLDGLSSDWLGVLHLRHGARIGLTSRTLFDDGFGIAKSETRLGFSGNRLTLGAGYLWVVAEPVEGRAERTHELTLDTAWSFNRHWSGSADMRYDIDADRATSAGIALGYRNECVALDLSLSRRFTSSTSVTPTTDVGLRVSLNGFGRDGRDYRRTCSG